MKINPSISLSEISKLINAEFIGDPDFKISGINEIHMVVAGDLTFVDHPKYYKKALNSNATTILINKKVDVPEGKAIIISEDPFSDFNALINHFQPFIPSTQMIDPSAKIGDGSIIQPGAFIGPNVKIGKNCLIHANVSIYSNTEIGDNVIIHSGTVLGADAFYFQRREGKTLKFQSCGRVIIKDNVEIGACCTIDKGVTGDTVIGEYTKLDNHIQIGHDTIVGKQCLIASQVGISGVVEIKDNVILWGQVGISKDLVIGENAVVLARSGVGKSLEGNKVYFGAPAIEARKKWREIAKIRELIKDKE